MRAWGALSVAAALASVVVLVWHLAATPGRPFEGAPQCESTVRAVDASRRPLYALATGLLLESSCVTNLDAPCGNHVFKARRTSLAMQVPTCTYVIPSGFLVVDALGRYYRVDEALERTDKVPAFERVALAARDEPASAFLVLLLAIGPLAHFVRPRSSLPFKVHLALAPFLFWVLIGFLRLL